MTKPKTSLPLTAALLSAVSASALPNLTPYHPSGWSSDVVVATSMNTTTESSTFLTTDSLYVAWCVINNGNQAINTSFENYLYVDGVMVQSWSIPTLGVNFYQYVNNYPIGMLSAGIHKIAIVADATDLIAESDETDNGYTNTITVGAVTLAAPTPQMPANQSTGQATVPFFAWSPVANAGSYRILVATNSADLPSSTTATNGGLSVVIDAVPLSTNFSPTIQLNPSTTYFWEVHGRTSTDDGTWSPVQQFVTGPIGNGLTIIPTFDTSITSDPQAAAIEATIKAALAVYRGDFSDPVTANITFTEMSGGLGYNNAYDLDEPYSSYLSALASHATTSDDATALANLPAGPNNPVNGDSQITLKLPLARALGFDADPDPGQPDGTVYLNTSIMNLTSFETDPNRYSLFATASHEVDEAIGFGSALNGLANGDPAPSGSVQPEDLFRYDQFGNRSLTADLGATAFFSLDGTDDLAQFSQFDGGDFGDWYSYNATVVPQVQDAFAPPGGTPVLGVELRALDVIGYTRIVPGSAPAAPQLTGSAASGSQFHFTLTGSAGASYIVQSSSNLLAWVPISTNAIPPSGSIPIIDNINGKPHQFYRAVAQ